MGEVVRGERSARTGARGPEEHLPLTPAVMDIVVALADEEPHGYAIMREVGPAPAAVCSPDLIGLLRRRARAIVWCKA